MTTGIPATPIGATELSELSANEWLTSIDSRSERPSFERSPGSVESLCRAM